MEQREYLDTVSLFAAGVTVITTLHDDRPHGMTANAVMSLSLNPMLIVLAVAKQAKMAGMLADGTPFTVNVLRDEQEAISNQFAGNRPSEKTPDFRFVEWEGGPRIEGSLAAIGCTVRRKLDGGDHWIIIGSVVSLLQGVKPHRPLLYFNRRYHRLESEAGTAAPDRLDFFDSEPQVFYDPW